MYFDADPNEGGDFFDDPTKRLQRMERSQPTKPHGRRPAR
jgi:hypothetical protein